MVKHYINFNIKKLHRGSIILIGNFDGFTFGTSKIISISKFI